MRIRLRAVHCSEPRDVLRRELRRSGCECEAKAWGPDSSMWLPLQDINAIRRSRMKVSISASSTSDIGRTDR